MPQRLAIVTPVLDDWPSLEELIRRIAGLFSPGDGVSIDIIVVDDGSTASDPPHGFDSLPSGCVASVEVLHLALNLGHQRAIAVGLVEAVERAAHDAVIVMDSDGEDRPEDIITLVAAGSARPGRIILAQRTKRSEPLSFRLGYAIYKVMFRALTGRRIGFGNFCLLPIAAAKRLVHMSEAWNHLAAAIMRSRLGYDEVPTQRGSRYDGSSHMSLTTLVIHGLSAISIFIDIIFVRVLIVGIALATLAVIGIAIVLVLRFLTPFAFPGWATSAIGALLGVIMQTVILVVIMTLVVLSGRSSSPIVPIVDCGKYIRSRRKRPLDTTIKS